MVLFKTKSIKFKRILSLSGMRGVLLYSDRAETLINMTISTDVHVAQSREDVLLSNLLKTPFKVVLWDLIFKDLT